MKCKVLLTGESRVAVSDIEEHLPENYSVKKCDVSNNELSGSLQSFWPGVVVICLGGEDSAEMMLYDHVLCDNPVYNDIQIIITGTNEDLTKIKAYFSREDITYIIRPFKIENIIKKIDSAYINIEEKERQETLSRQAEEVFDNSDEKKHILVIDDDIRTLKNIKNLLTGMYQVAVATSGSVALKYLEKHECDIILLDYVMPEEDGPEVLKQIRDIPQFADIPVIFLTGVKDSDMVKKCLSLKPQGYLLKPVNSNVLYKRIEEALVL